MAYLLLADPLPAPPISADVLASIIKNECFLSLFYANTYMYSNTVYIHADTVVEITIADL